MDFIEYLNGIKKKAERASENFDYEQEKELWHKYIDFFSKLNRIDQSKNEHTLYLPYRGLCMLYFNSNDFKSAINYIDLSLNIIKKDDKIDCPENIYILKRMQAHSKLRMYLDTKDEDLLNEAEVSIVKMKNEINNINLPSLQAEIEDDFDLVQRIKTNSLCTKLEFELPFPLYLSENSIIEFPYLANNYTISIKNIAINNKNVEFKEDKYGFINRSKVTIIVDCFISHNESFTDEELDNNSAIPKPIIIAVNAINHFIEHYRIVTKRYWINTISNKMIYSLNHSFKIGKKKTICAVIYNGAFSNKKNLGMSTMNALSESLQSNNIELWQGLYCDAKDYKLINRYREAILSINSAFENFLNINVPKRLSEGLEKDEIHNFMIGKITYDSFSLKDYLSEQDFDEAKSKELIEESEPSTFKLLKKCNEICPFGISNTKLTKLVDTIRTNRNELIHGYKCITTEDMVNKAIIGFEKLVKLFGFEI